MKKYWVLLSRTNGKWSVQFGDYSRMEVVYERHAMRREFKATDLWVTGLPCKANGHAPSQATIDSMLEVLNNG